MKTHKMNEKQFDERLKHTLKRGLIAPCEYAENYVENYVKHNVFWEKVNTKDDYRKMKKDYEKMKQEAQKEAEAMQKFNGEIILEAFREVIEDAENYDEALEMVIEGHLLFESIPGYFNRRNELELYGYEYVLKIIEEEFGAEVWTYVSPTDNGALVDLATEAEARTHARFFYDLAQS